MTENWIDLENYIAGNFRGFVKVTFTRKNGESFEEYLHPSEINGISFSKRIFDDDIKSAKVDWQGLNARDWDQSFVQWSREKEIPKEGRII